MVSSLLIELRIIKVFADRRYDSCRNRTEAYDLLASCAASCDVGVVIRDDRMANACACNTHLDGSSCTVASCFSTRRRVTSISLTRFLHLDTYFVPAFQTKRIVRIETIYLARGDSNPMEGDVSSRTYAQSLRTFVPSASHQLLIQDAVRRVHRIKLLASEFFMGWTPVQISLLRLILQHLSSFCFFCFSFFAFLFFCFLVFFCFFVFSSFSFLFVQLFLYCH